MLETVYNNLTLAQACLLALDGDRTGRVRYVLRTAQVLYGESTTVGRLLSELAALDKRDPQARRLFRGVHECYAERMAGNSDYFQEVIMGKESEWRKSIP
jgi:hypothetical protein